MERVGRSVWVLFTFCLIFCLAALGELTWIYWKFVPVHAVVFAGLAAELQLQDRIVISASHWFIRSYNQKLWIA